MKAHNGISVKYVFERNKKQRKNGKNEHGNVQKTQHN